MKGGREKRHLSERNKVAASRKRTHTHNNKTDKTTTTGEERRARECKSSRENTTKRIDQQKLYRGEERSEGTIREVEESDTTTIPLSRQEQATTAKPT
jgi:hypothetical protein